MKVQAIADFLGVPVLGNPDLEVDCVASLEDAGPTAVCWAKGRYLEFVGTTRAGLVMVPHDFSIVPQGRALIPVQDPKVAFARVSHLLNPKEVLPPAIHPTAVIAKDAILGRDVHIGPHVVIESGANIGDGSMVGAGTYIGRQVRLGVECQIYPHVTLYHEVELHDRVIVHAGTVIGADGFGYVFHAGLIKMPNVGRVIVESDVEIGANTCIDRGSLGNTVVARGSKIDNLCQIAHNVRIGADTVIAAQAGIAGSCVIGDGCQIGGQVGIGESARVLSGVNIGGQSGVLPHDTVKATKRPYFGTPIAPKEQLFRTYRNLKELSKLLAPIKRLLNEPGRNQGQP